MQRPNVWLIAFAFLLVLGWLSNSSAIAKPGDVLFEDDFSTLDPVYDPSANDFSVSDNTLKFPLPKELYQRVMYQANLFDAVDVTVKVRLEVPDGEKDAKIGVAFWALDRTTFYVFQISDFGTYRVVSITPDKWTIPIGWRKSSAIKKDPGEWNELRVVAIGNRAVLFINGEKVAVVKGKPPADGSLVGVYRESGTEPSVGYFSAFKAVEPDPSLVPQVKEDPNEFLRDDFAELDPAWGAASGNFDVRDGVLNITVDPGFLVRRTNGATEVTGDVDISAKITMSGGDDKNTTVGGLSFFESASDDYWTVTITNDGLFAVSHWVKTRWLTPVSYRKIPDQAKWVKGEAADLKLSIRDKKLTVIVNGIEIVQFNAQPPKAAWQVGVYGESGTIGFDDLVIVRASKK